MSNLKIVKTTEIKEIRERLLKEQNYMCPLCKRIIKEDEAVLDHSHIKRNKGDGTIRQVLHRGCNVFLGMIENNHLRACIPKDILTTFLSNSVKYLETKKFTNILHPSERPKKEVFKKSIFNRLKKMYSQKYPKRKELIYPKSKQITKKFELLLEEFKLS